MSKNAISRSLALLLFLSSLALVYNSSKRMSVTFDEITHYFCGLEYLQEGEYTAWPENPLLSRVVTAIGPYLHGYRGEGFTVEGDDLGMWDHFFNAYRMEYLHDSSIENPLALIRYGVMIVFALSVVLVWLWSRRLSGDYGAMIATGMYAFTPLILGHSGLATTDISFVCAFTFLLWSFFRWLNTPSLTNGFIFGLALAIGLLTKFTVLPFFGLAMVVAFFIKWLKTDAISYFPLRPWMKSWVPSGLVATTVMILGVWGFHGFDVGAIGDEPVIKTLISVGAVTPLYTKIVVPAPEWFAGIVILLEHNEMGQIAYMFGELSFGGFWYFYPVGLTIKTPIPALIFGLLGIFAIVKKFKTLNWELLALFFIPFALMLSLVTSHLNIGTRHITAVYPLFCIGAVGSFLFYLKNTTSKYHIYLKFIPALLLTGQILVAARTYPNYTNYFNILAGDEPGKIMGDSDLGWGQGLIELSNYCKENNIDTLNLSYFGIADECLYDLPEIVLMPRNKEVKGWVAVSENNYYGIFSHRETKDSTDCPLLRIEFLDITEPHDYYRWLDNYEMKTKLAGSIRVYYVE